MVFAALGMTQLYRVDSGVTLEQEFTSKTGNQITQELVDAFEKGSVTLDVKPSEGLKALEIRMIGARGLNRVQPTHGIMYIMKGITILIMESRL